MQITCKDIPHYILYIRKKERKNQKKESNETNLEYFNDI